MVEFIAFPKIARLSRECVITEKLDGTNAAVHVVAAAEVAELNATASSGVFFLYAQSRSRFITPGADNFGFAGWVREHADDLVLLGEGVHFGEWWGSGIQRGYGLPKGERRFSLFNVSKWSDAALRPACCHVVPELWRGAFDNHTAIRDVMDGLARTGSIAAPGFMNPEGIVIFHTGRSVLFKKTFEGDDEGKGRAA